jgi:hypothetical protein
MSETVFDKATGSVSQLQVDALFLSFITRGIIQLEPKKNDASLQWLIGRGYGTSTNSNSFIEAHLGIPKYKREVS